MKDIGLTIFHMHMKWLNEDKEVQTQPQSSNNCTYIKTIRRHHNSKTQASSSQKISLMQVVHVLRGGWVFLSSFACKHMCVYLGRGRPGQQLIQAWKRGIERWEYFHLLLIHHQLDRRSNGDIKQFIIKILSYLFEIIRCISFISLVQVVCVVYRPYGLYIAMYEVMNYQLIKELL